MRDFVELAMWFVRLPVVLAVVLLTACTSTAATWQPRAILAEVEVFDRTTGARLPVYEHNGRRWVAGTPGHRYAVAVRNVSGGRVLAVIAVDGVNAVTGETAAWHQNGYVFMPGQRWEIRGWRKSHERVAAFEFTALGDSYAARTGRPDHVGVIGVALFRERVPLPASPPAPLAPFSSRDAPAADASSRQRAEKSTGDTAAAPSERLGTGHGRSEVSRVLSTEFERAAPYPDQVVTIHYDSRENLIAMGVIPHAPAPQPFPASAGFVPDPPLR
jgi:hypothetical protein